MKTLYTALISLSALGAAFAPAHAAEAVAEYKTVLQDHRFTPDVIKVKAGEKFKLIVENKDATAEEFEMPATKREKMIPANGSGVIRLGPLEAGQHKFVGEFHEKTAVGTIVAE